MAAGFKTATVRSGDVPATQTNFPSYVDLDRLGITTLAEAQSIRVYADEAKTVEWAREIVSATEMHVKVPSLTSTVDIYVDWDGVRSDYAVGATYGRNAVWSDYALVWHSDSTTDSTGNSSFSASGGISLGGSTGKIGGATTFDGSDDVLEKSGTLSEYDINADFTVTTWINPTSIPSSTGGLVLGQYVSGTNRTILGVVNSRVTANIYDGSFTTKSAAISTGAWSMVHFILDSKSISLFLNGSSETATSDLMGIADTANELKLGRSGPGNQQYTGLIDETRIRESVITSDWITTEYNNQNDEATFWGTWTDAGGAPAAQAARRGAVMMM